MSNGSVPAVQATAMCKPQSQSDVKEDQPKRVVITQPLHGEHRPTVPDATPSLQSLQADPPLSGRTSHQSSPLPGSDSGAQPHREETTSPEKVSAPRKGRLSVDIACAAACRQLCSTEGYRLLYRICAAGSKASCPLFAGKSAAALATSRGTPGHVGGPQQVPGTALLYSPQANSWTVNLLKLPY